MTTRQQTTIHQSGLAQQPIILALLGIGFSVQPFFAQNVNSGLAAFLVAPVNSANHRPKTQIEALHRFTHFSYIPASTDPGTIKFKGINATKVLTKLKSTMDLDYCSDLQFRDPGGSLYCPDVEQESRVAAYKVTYSYIGEPLASDEYGNRQFTVGVYFRPEELPGALRSALSAGKMKRAELATYFKVETSRLPVRAAAIDEATSSFCDGNYRDGTWIHNDPRCNDKVSFKTVTMPSDYITVQVEPAPSQPQETVVSR